MTETSSNINMGMIGGLLWRDCVVEDDTSMAPDPLGGAPPEPNKKPSQIAGTVHKSCLGNISVLFLYIQKFISPICNAMQEIAALQVLLNHETEQLQKFRMHIM